jgi:hypothetical protein
MATQTDLAVRIATIFDEAGIKKADKAVNKLQKNTVKLGRALGVSLGVAAVAAFGRAAVKAFSEDEKAAVRLTNSVKNLGLAFEQINIDTFIKGLEKSASIADDVLRPAFQALLTTTGSVTEAQKLLTTAVDASRGSGYDLATVAGDLSKAYVGNTKGLQKYYLGLTKAELASMSFEEIQAKINKTFEGANKAYLDTAAGKLEAISLASGNFAETVGGALVNALVTATGSGGVEGLVLKIDSLATSVSDTIGKLEVLSFSLRYAFNPKNIFKGSEEYKKALNKFTSDLQMRGVKGFDPLNNALTGYKVDQKAAADAKKAADLQAKLLKQSLAAQKALTAEQKKQAALKKAGTVFDLDQIQIVAALKGKLSEEDKVRLQAQLALLNGNADLATRLTNQIIAAQDSSGNLARFLSALPNAKNPFEYLDAYLSYLAGKAAAVLTGTTAPNVPSTNATAAPMPTASEMAASGSFSQLVAQGAGASGGFSPVVAAAMQPQVIELKITGDGDLTNTIAKNLMQQSLSTGNQTYVNRRTGGFE